MPPKSIVQKQTNPLKPILTLRVITIKHLTFISGLNYGKIKFEYQYTLAGEPPNSVPMGFII